MNKKIGALFLTTFLISLLLVSFVIAQDNSKGDIAANIPSDSESGLDKFLGSLNTYIDSFAEGIQPIAKQLLGDSQTGNLLFAKILFFIIIFAVIWVALGRVSFFSEQTWVLIVISLAVSILGTRFLANDALINTILLPYSTIAIAISAGLPFALYFLIVNVGMNDPKYKLARKIAWIFFAVIFTGLWISRQESLLLEGSNAGWIYPITVALAIAMVFLDGTIKRWMLRNEIENIAGTNREDAILKVRKDITDIQEMHNANTISDEERTKLIKRANKKLKTLMK